MPRWKLKIYFIVSVPLLCAPPMVDAARIVSITTCQKVSEPGTIPINIRDQFTSGAPKIHAVVVLEKVKPGTRVKDIWVAVDAIQTPTMKSLRQR